MKQSKDFKYLTLLAILIATVMQLSCIVAYKTVMFGSLILPGGIIGFPLVFTMSDIVAEVYGYKAARKILWEAIICTAFFIVTIMLIIRLPSPPDWHFEADYNIVFSNLPRVFLAVLFGVSISSFVNIYLISKWKIRLKGKYFWARSFFSSAIGELAITFIADITAFLGTMPFKEFLHMVLSVYFIKVVYALLAAIPAACVVVLLKKYEDVDIYDYSTNFNPFSLKQ